MGQPLGTRIGKALKELDSAKSIAETRKILARLRTEDPEVYQQIQDADDE